MPDASPGATPERPASRTWRRRIRATELVALVALVGLGAAIRAHGFSTEDLWYDDAWVALSARVGVGTALRMGLAAPGYLLALRSWIRLDPGSTPWIQAPDFVLGVLAIPATWALLRWFRMPRWIAIGGALLVTVMPVLVLYSTRVKEYPFDFLAACLLLGLHEGVRRRPSARRLAALGVASALSVVASGSCVVVVVAIWAVVVLQLARSRPLRVGVGAWCGVVAASCAIAWVAFYRHLPRSLYAYWRVRGYLYDWHSLASLEKSVSLSFGGFVHEAFGLPAAPGFFRYADGIHSAPLTAAGLVLVSAIVGVPIWLAWRARAVTAALASVLVLLLAIVLSVVGVVPFGDGRTDEVLYPALLICLATSTQAFSAWVRAREPAHAAVRAVAVAGGAILVLGALAFGVLHPADYPTIDLRGVAAQLQRQLRPGDVVLVSTFDSFGWCYYRLSPCTVVVGGSPSWIQGFRPASSDRAVFIAMNQHSVLPQMLTALHRSTVWYVGFTYGTYDVASSAAAQDRPVETQMLRVLASHGWRLAGGRPGAPSRLLATHAFAWRFVRALPS